MKLDRWDRHWQYDSRHVSLGVSGKWWIVLAHDEPFARTDLTIDTDRLMYARFVDRKHALEEFNRLVKEHEGNALLDKWACDKFDEKKDAGDVGERVAGNGGVLGVCFEERVERQ